MLKKILTAYKELRLSQEKLKELEAENESLKTEIYFLKSKSLSSVLKSILDQDLSWYDFGDLKPNDKKIYFAQAQQILRTHVFNNEMNFLKSNWGKQAIIDVAGKGLPAAETVQKMSWMLLGIEYLKTRLLEIPDPNPIQKTKEDIHSAV